MFNRTFGELDMFGGTNKICDVFRDPNLIMMFVCTTVNTLTATAVKVAMK